MTTVRELIADGTCSAGCIAATTDASRCRCPCRDRSGTPLHGLLADADCSTLLDARGRNLRRLTDLEVISA